jgi:hypothetical protein
MLIKQLSANLKKVSRLDGESNVKVAAYIKRGIVYDERDDFLYDFTHKAGDLLYSGVFLPNNAPMRFQNEVVLLNEANNAEKRYDARTGRTLRCSLPNGLPIGENVKIVKEICGIFTVQGMCAFAVIHEGKNIEEPAKNKEISMGIEKFNIFVENINTEEY